MASFVTESLLKNEPPALAATIVYGIGAAEAGLVLGLSFAVAGWLGITLGGVISDALRARTANARVLVGLAAIVLAAPTAAALLLVDDLFVAYVLNFVLSIFASCWIGGAASTVNDLVMPRMRAVASAFYVLMATVGLALGPYAVGEVSDVLAAGGMASGESLRLGLLLSLTTLTVPAIFLALLLRELGPAEASRLERARAAGEPV